MNPIDYLRGVVLRDRQAAAPAPEPKPVPTLGWTNPVRTAGACVHDVIYSRCYCKANTSAILDA